MRILPINNTIMNSLTYILYSELEEYCILIDCGEYVTLQPVLDKLGKKVRAVLLTHGHMDHIYGLNRLIKDNPLIEIFASEIGHLELHDSTRNLSFCMPDPISLCDYNEKVVKEGDKLCFDNIGVVDVFEVPGHDPSCLAFKIGSNLFTGDSYIPGIKVFTKFPGADKKLAMKSREKLKILEKNGCKIYCGHHDYL